MVSVVRNPYFPKQEHYFMLNPRSAAMAAFAIYTMANPIEAQWESLYAHCVLEVGDGSFMGGNWRAVLLKP